MGQFSLEKRFAQTVLTIVLVLGSVAACGTPEQVTPTSLLPTSTVEALKSPLQPTPTTPLPTLEAGFGGVSGALVSYPPAWAGSKLSVYLAPFYPTGQNSGEGFFVLEPSEHPRAPVLGGGLFVVENVPPAQYVVVIGPTPAEALVVQEDGRPKVFQVLEGEVLDIGEVRLDTSN